MYVCMYVYNYVFGMARYNRRRWNGLLVQVMVLEESNVRMGEVNNVPTGISELLKCGRS